MGLGVIGFFNPSTWIQIVTIGTSIYFVGKDKVQEIMANFVPPLIGSGSLVVVTTSSLWKLVGNSNIYLNQFSSKPIICIAIKL